MKNVEIGNLIVKEKEDGSKNVFLALGRKNKDPKYSKYDVSVEITVKDSTGKIIAQQKDGFINLSDPRTTPDELLAKKIISEDAASDMKERASRLPDSIRYVAQVARK